MELKTLSEIEIISAPHSKINEIDFGSGNHNCNKEETKLNNSRSRQ